MLSTFYINSRQTRFSILFILVFFISFSAFSEEVEHSENNTKYDPKPAIMEHIADANEWHIMGHTHIPLPVILYDITTGGWTLGMSSDFPVVEENATEESLSEYGMKEGRIVSLKDHQLLDLSITKNVFALLVSAALLLIVFLTVAKACKTNKGKAPKGIQNLIEPIIIFMKEEVIEPNLGKESARFVPYLLTLFFFILFNNLLGLVPLFPGGANVTGNIAITFVLAIFTLFLTNINAKKDYWKHIFMPPAPVWLWPILIPIELIGVISKPFALMIRLFANISAGHIIVLSLTCLIFVFGKAGMSLSGSAIGSAIAIPFVLFISIIEILVAFLQAFIFTMLTAVFLGLALEEHHHEEHAH